MTYELLHTEILCKVTNFLQTHFEVNVYKGRKTFDY
jgi:hypothetical protein